MVACTNLVSSPSTRRLLNDQEKRERALELFGRPEVGFLEMLTSKKLFNILDAALDKRNKKAHSGIVSDQDAKQLLTFLESDLSEIREVIADWYTTALLLSPENAEFREDVFHYRVKALTGSRTVFRQRSVTTLAPMDTSRLYLLHESQYQPVKLLPFFRLMPSPRTEENACYFYSRIEGGEVRWISYHFPAESEVVRADAEVVEALSLLRPRDDS